MLPAKNHRSDIDGLRGLAIFCVLLYHASASVLPAGFIGVDIFFVISGYLITGIVLNDLAVGRFSLRRFYGRRIRRIFPALLAVLVFCIIVGWFVLLPNEYAALGRHIAASALFVSNIALWKESGYFDTASDLKPLLHLWSLAVEEQFYLFWPPLLWLAWRLKRIIPLLVILALSSLIASIVFTPDYPIASFFLPATRFWELMAGGMLAYREFHRRAPIALQPTARECLAIAGLAAILVATILFSKFSLYPSWRALMPIAGTVALIAAGMPAYVNRRLLGHPWLVALGLISYPLYLWHWPLLAFTRIVAGGESSPAVRTGAVMLSILLAWLTARYLEAPIRFGRLRQSRRILAAMVAALLVIGGAGFAVKRTDGLPYIRGLESARVRDLARADWFSKTKVPCPTDFNGATLDWCVTARAGSPDIALYGDSHAEHLFAGLAEDIRHNWLLIGASSCPPLVDIDMHAHGDRLPCLEKNARAVHAVIATPSIRTVLIASLGPYYISDTNFAPDHEGKNDAKLFRLDSTRADEAGMSKAELYYRGMDRTISTLENSGKKVVLFIDVPELNFMPERCLKRPISLPEGDHHAVCGVERSLIDARAAPYRALMQRLANAHPKAMLFDPYPYLCDAQYCYAGNDEMLYYHDSHHLSLRGSRMVMGHFLEWLNK